MLILLSPAKNLNFDPAPDGLEMTKPALFSQTKILAEETRKLSRGDIQGLMGISDKLADLNYERFQSFKKTALPADAKQAALAFNGEVYTGLDAASLSDDDFAFAQDHLRLLSGLYGALRPLDGISPYRLEMGTKLQNERGKSLYDFWGDHIAKELNKTLSGKEDFILNLASNEYFKSVNKKLIEVPIITPSFKEVKDGKARMLMVYAKQARGMMARWAIQNRITKIDDLKKFNLGGYKFQKDLEEGPNWTFQRPQPAPKK